MLARFRARLLSRVASALVALAISGAPGLARGGAAPRHTCACPSHGPHGACGCASSRRASARDAVAKPPCHAAKGERPGRDAAATTCAQLTGACGVPDGQVPPPRTLEPFYPPCAVALAPRPLSEHVVTVVAARSEQARAPEIPPPRRA